MDIKQQLTNLSTPEQIEACDFLANEILKLKTITNYANLKGKSYNGVNRFNKSFINVDKVKFIVSK